MDEQVRSRMGGSNWEVCRISLSKYVLEYMKFIPVEFPFLHLLKALFKMTMWVWLV